MTSSDLKKASKKGFRKWFKDHFQIVLSFGIALLSMIVGILSNLAADSFLSKFSLQNLEVIIAVLATFLTIAVALIPLLRQKKRDDIRKSQNNSGGKESNNE